MAGRSWRNTPTTVSDAMKPLYLASQSPRRLHLLEQLGLSPTLMTPEPHEDAESLEAVRPGEAPRTYVQRVTRLKLEASLRRMKRLGWPAGVVLCADTTVARGRQIVGKPDSPDQALAMLQGLQGQTHRVLTCVAVGTLSRQQRDEHRVSLRLERRPERHVRSTRAAYRPKRRATRPGAIRADAR